MYLSSQLQIYQILTNYVQMLILFLSYYITTVRESNRQINFDKSKNRRIAACIASNIQFNCSHLTQILPTPF